MFQLIKNKEENKIHLCSEIVCEIRWGLTMFKQHGVKTDKYFEILLGKSYNDFVEKLPNVNHKPAIIHNENIGRESKISFSKNDSESQVSTIQMGPGVMYINQTNVSDIGKFIDLCIYAKNTLVKNHPQLNEFIITSKTLRFIYDLNLGNNYNWFEVLKEKGINISLDEHLISGCLKQSPDIANISLKFPTKQVDAPDNPAEKLIVETLEYQFTNMAALHRCEIGIYIDNFEKIDSSSNPKEFENWLKSKKNNRQVISI